MPFYAYEVGGREIRVLVTPTRDADAAHLTDSWFGVRNIYRYFKDSSDIVEEGINAPDFAQPYGRINTNFSDVVELLFLGNNHQI